MYRHVDRLIKINKYRVLFSLASLELGLCSQNPFPAFMECECPTFEVTLLMNTFSQYLEGFQLVSLTLLLLLLYISALTYIVHNLWSLLESNIISVLLKDVLLIAINLVMKGIVSIPRLQLGFVCFCYSLVDTGFLCVTALAVLEFVK